MRGRHSRVRRGRGFAGRPRCARMICRLPPCEPGRLRGRCRLMRCSLRCTGRLYRTRGCRFRFRLSHGPKPRTWLRTGCCRRRRVPGLAGVNASRGRQAREIGRARRPSRSRWRNGRLGRLLFGGMGCGGGPGRLLGGLLLPLAGASRAGRRDYCTPLTRVRLRRASGMRACRRDCSSCLTRVLFRRSSTVRASRRRCRLLCGLRHCAGKLRCRGQLRKVRPHRRTPGRFCPRGRWRGR